MRRSRASRWAIGSVTVVPSGSLIVALVASIARLSVRMRSLTSVA
jgi:hypothetical protein